MLRLARCAAQSYNPVRMLKVLTSSLPSSLLIGLLSGAAVTGLLHSLGWVTRFRVDHPAVTWCLPLAGALIGLLRKHLRGLSTGGPLPLLYAPAVFFSTLLTHLCGGSAGREGAAFRISTGITRLMPGSVRNTPEQQQTLLSCALAAGFASALGAPTSGLVFAWEFSKSRRLNWPLPFLMILSVMAALITTELLHTEHLILPKFRGEVAERFPGLLVASLLSIPIFTGLGWIFRKSLHLGESRGNILGRLLPRLTVAWSWRAIRGFAGGSLLLLLYLAFDLTNYQGLGIGTIQEAFQGPSSWVLPILKLVLTVITLAAGFRGGEFMPLFFIGSTAGSALTSSLGAGEILLPALGCVTVYGVASRSPWTALALAGELFGIGILPFAAVNIGGAMLLASGLRRLAHQRPPTPA